MANHRTLTHAEEIAHDLMKQYQKALDKSLELQSKKDSYMRDSRLFWEIVDKLDRAQNRCRYIDKQLQDHLLTIKPNLYQIVTL